ncbi:hypothetical protein [Leptospira johnsonii]|uniref:Uncharacterized protein n=1 Tax=Leptospira johnsonii TaxID=1917820 RepID=A0A2P2D7V5_9LEPT|nr:hypothetical protein [Leptospira johnsonii]GBF40713.1 hypothetical protein LPTSP1_37310 [Leptospira johnsonii]
MLVGFFRAAYRFEAKAATLLEKETNIEPSQTILYRSAAALALKADKPREAEIYTCKALTGNPPEYLLEELRNLLEEIHFARHNELKGIELDDKEIQLSLVGNEVGFGIIHSNIFIDKFNVTEKMLYRIVERKLKKPFRTKGRIEEKIKDDFQLYLSVPRAASYAITIKLGKPKNEPILPGIENQDSVIEELLKALEYVNDRKEDQLKEIIPEEDYYRNFIALAQSLAPDGENIKMVGFTANVNNAEKSIIFNRLKSSFLSNSISDTDEIISIEGTLSFADAKKNKIKITDDNNKDFIILVDHAILADIVKPLWEDKVLLKGKKITGRNEYSLIDIQPMSELNGA